MNRLLSTLLCLFLGADQIGAQRATLTDSEVEAAIAAGLKAKGDDQGLELREGGFLRASGASATTGFSIVIYTPTTWIRQMASVAAKQYRPFTRADVTPDMLQPVLRVVVHADTPREMTAEARRRASSVEHVVIRDRKRSAAIQPAALEPFEATVSNALGARETFESQIAKFSIGELQTIRGAGNDEFVITVIGSGADSLGRARNEKNFEIKRGAFSRIP